MRDLKRSVAPSSAISSSKLKLGMATSISSMNTLYWRRPTSWIDRYNDERGLKIHLTIDGFMLFKCVLKTNSGLFREILNCRFGSIHEHSNGVQMDLWRCEESSNGFDELWVMKNRHTIHLGKQCRVRGLV
ncbi:hypothetical protein OGAPHI_004384 [Ogataea philodendri]|uniref:Uncharacterized protein n=1 Tax=Ogataea philodendri TaxID=1378263 RepID=A0A9P8P6L6_9ASCO|nr:uncharacterized protein OGAPHI_004384 [Ogataea philodendri]KAH3666195.1 hypothetical protein OGAPHI_004384 [Ogataea philodendri]